jgi:trigger factor
MYMQYIGQDITAFRAQCRPTAERRVKTELLLDKIAEVEGIEVTAEEIAEEYQKVADQYDTDLDTVKNAVPESAIVGDMKARRAAELIFNTGVPTEPVAPAAEETAEQAPAEEKKPAKKTTRKTTKKAAAEAPAEETAE